MVDKNGVRDISSTTLHLSPLTGNPYPAINEFTYKLLAPEIQALYVKDLSSLSYGYFGKLVEKP